jgi:transcriptional regulator with XRE-family HTH domain
MRGPRRSKIQRTKDLEEIARRYLRGETQVQIAEAIGVTQRQISYDLKKIREAWIASSVRDFDEIVAGQLARIDELERTYWQAWIDSGGIRKRTTVKGRGSGGREQPDNLEQIVTTEDSPGDPRFLAGVQWCIAERSKLLGAYALTRQEVTSDAGPLVIQVIYGRERSGNDSDTSA